MKQYVIVGASAAGMSCATTLRQLDPLARIVCISSEKQLPYNTCFLADYLSASKQERELFLKDEHYYRKHDITLRLGFKVVRIDAQDKQVVLADGMQIEYDQLLLATGTSAEIPMINGFDRSMPGMFLFHTLYNIRAIGTYIEASHPKKAIIIGAGLSGIECADSLTERGIQTILIELSDRVLPQILPQGASEFLIQAMNRLGIQVLLNASITKITSDNAMVYTVQLADGTILNADMIIVATGAQPNIGLAQSARIDTNRYGVVVNDYLQTSVKDIYAAGDIIQVKDNITSCYLTSCLWSDAMAQGRFAAYAMAGKPKRYPGAQIIISSAFFGMKLAATGLVRCDEVIGADMEQTLIKTEGSFYHQFMVHNGYLKGFVLIGNTARLSLYKRALLTGQPFDQIGIGQS